MVPLNCSSAFPISKKKSMLIAYRITNSVGWIIKVRGPRMSYQAAAIKIFQWLNIYIRDNKFKVRIKPTHKTYVYKEKSYQSKKCSQPHPHQSNCCSSFSVSLVAWLLSWFHLHLLLKIMICFVYPLSLHKLLCSTLVSGLPLVSGLHCICTERIF
jgi:hypothetical protein